MSINKKGKRKLSFDTGNELLEYLRIRQIPLDVAISALALALTETAIYVGIPHEIFVDKMSETYKRMSTSKREDKSCH